MSSENGWWTTAEEGVTAAMNKRGRTHQCKPLEWAITTAVNPDRTSPMTLIAELTGMAGPQYADEEVPAVLAAWARMLGIDGGVVERHPGAIEYSGHLAPHRLITLWGVVDRAVWDAR